MDLSQYLGLFLSETREHLQKISGLTVALEADGEDRSAIDALFRSAHSIKGMAASMGFNAVAELAHRMEDLLDRVRRGMKPDAGLFDLILAGEAQLSAMLDDIAAGGSGELDSAGLLAGIAAYQPAAETGAAPQPAKPEPVPAPVEQEPATREENAVPQTVKVKTELLDRFVNTTGELITVRNRLEMLAAEAGDREIAAALETLGKHLRELHDQVMTVRLLPLATITENFPRLVRDIARRSGKEVSFSMQGMEIELDRSILELLGDPLTHLLRNAVDHGIESPADRTVAGKAERGRIGIAVIRLCDQIEIRIEDDGRGMDQDAIAARAVERGFVSPELAAELSAEEKLQLVCHPGFSTAAAVTDISGRGVGMDVVKTAIQSLGGTLAISSEPGKGSCFLLRLPLTVAIINALMVKAGGSIFAVPLTAVNRTMLLPVDEVGTIDGSEVFFFNGEAVPLLPLSRLLDPGRGEAERAEMVQLLLTEANGRMTALAVDSLIGAREIFVKPLGRPLNAVRGLGGATIFGDGEVVFVLDIISRLQ